MQYTTRKILLILYCSHDWEPYSRDSVPQSCCDTKANRPCTRQTVPTTSHNEGYNRDVTLHMTGCREAMVDYVQTNVISGVWVFMAMFIIEVGICIVILTIALVFNLGLCLYPSSVWHCCLPQETYIYSPYRNTCYWQYTTISHIHVYIIIKRLPRPHQLN